ncbi:MAG: protein arginine kinase [Phycisphaerales bacterium]|nr:protein arginine kinase [Phycisphaerales bacterium]
MQSSDQPEPMKSTPFDRNTQWLRGDGDACDVVMSSRARLARNLAGFPFTSQGSESDQRQVLDACKERILSMPLENKAQMLWVDLHGSKKEDRSLLVERQLMSRQHAKGKQSNGAGNTDSPRGIAVLLPDEHVSVMVNDEDHLRMQMVHSGFGLGQCLQEINAIDDAIEDGIDYAYDARFGYLTACPTNVGTGLRLSVLLHLPALSMFGDLDKVRNATRDMGLAVRGIYGEGSESVGDFYQISNQTTLGKSDEALLSELEDEIIPRIIRYERHARNALLEKKNSVILDEVHRAIGILSRARLMKTDEAMGLLSLARLGALAGIIDEVQLGVIHTLMLQVQPAHLQKTLGVDLNQQQRRLARAEIIRTKLGLA